MACAAVAVCASRSSLIYSSGRGLIRHFDGVACVAKFKQMFELANSPQELRRRAEGAISEGRFQTAVDLAKQLNHLEPGRHADLLSRSYLGRASQLREQGA